MELVFSTENTLGTTELDSEPGTLDSYIHALCFFTEDDFFWKYLTFQMAFSEFD